MLTHIDDDPQSSNGSVPAAGPGLEEARKQVDRILASDTMHASEVLRRLLRFLADKTFSGEADDLKEYSVGLDALGKPATYDPRQDAGVRIQASRLRQKLDEYYRREGRNDPLVVELRKGRFKIAWHPNSGDIVPVAGVQPLPATAAPRGPVDTTIELRNLKRWRSLAMGFAAVSMLLAFAAIWTLSRQSRTLAAKPESAASTPDMDALWSPFLSSAHHLIIAFANPLFVRFQRNEDPDIVYHKIGNNSWDDALGSPELSVLSRALGNPPAEPTFNMVERSSWFPRSLWANSWHAVEAMFRSPGCSSSRGNSVRITMSYSLPHSTSTKYSLHCRSGLHCSSTGRGSAI